MSTAICMTPTATETTPDRVFEVLGRHMLVDGFHLVVDLERSHGSRILDSATGRWFVDFYTFFASSPIGMNHPGMRDPRWTPKLLNAAINKPSNSDAYTVELASFVTALERSAMPRSLPYLFLVEGGALAVCNALKVAIDWKVRKNQARGAGAEKGAKVIHFREAFHGREGYTLSLTNTDPVKTDYYPKFDWPRIENPKVTFPLEGQNLVAVEAAERRALAQIDEAFSRNPDEIAAVIIEPIQGEGGDNHFRGMFLRELRRICDEREAMLIFDEVQTGVGITGKMWAHEHFGVEPDILCFGKKLQVCGIMVSRRIEEVRDHVFKVSGRINSTWGGNLTDMVRGARYLEIIEEERLIENATRMGDLLFRRLRDMQIELEGKVLNARGRGLMCAFDLETPELRKLVIDRCHENGLLILATGRSGIRFRPALNITHEDLEEGLALLRRSISEAVR